MSTTTSPALGDLRIVRGDTDNALQVYTGASGWVAVNGVQTLTVFPTGDTIARADLNSLAIVPASMAGQAQPAA
jgi:hypothetical protein